MEKFIETRYCLEQDSNWMSLPKIWSKSQRQLVQLVEQMVKCSPQLLSLRSLEPYCSLQLLRLQVIDSAMGSFKFASLSFRIETLASNRLISPPSIRSKNIAQLQRDAHVLEFDMNADPVRLHEPVRIVLVGEGMLQKSMDLAFFVVTSRAILDYTSASTTRLVRDRNELDPLVSTSVFDKWFSSQLQVQCFVKLSPSSSKKR